MNAEVRDARPGEDSLPARFGISQVTCCTRARKHPRYVLRHNRPAPLKRLKFRLLERNRLTRAILCFRNPPGLACKVDVLPSHLQDIRLAGACMQGEQYVVTNRGVGLCLKGENPLTTNQKVSGSSPDGRASQEDGFRVFRDSASFFYYYLVATLAVHWDVRRVDEARMISQDARSDATLGRSHPLNSRLATVQTWAPFPAYP